MRTSSNRHNNIFLAEQRTSAGRSVGKSVAQFFICILFLLCSVVGSAFAQQTVNIGEFLNSATVTASEDQFEENKANNDSQVQVFPKTELTIIKTVVNDDGGQATASSFTISAEDTTNNVTSNPDFSDTTTSDGTKSFTAETLYFTRTTTNRSAINLNEEAFAGYTTAGWVCEIRDADNNTSTVSSTTTNGISIDLGAAEAATCTVTNNDIPASVVLVKDIINDNGGNNVVGDFNIQIGDTTFVTATTESITDGVRYTSERIVLKANTDFSLSEQLGSGYTSEGWSCSSGMQGSGTSVDVNLGTGASATCSITNNDIAPMLTLVKVIQNDSGGNVTSAESFSITLSQDGASTQSFTSSESTTSNPTTTITSTVFELDSNTDYTLQEIQARGYKTEGWACDAGFAQSNATSGTLNLNEGANVKCTIINNDKGVDLSIVKSVSNMTPVVGETVTFTLAVHNSGDDPATNVKVEDVLPEGFAYAGNDEDNPNGVTQSNNTNAPNLSWIIDKIKQDETISISFDVTINQPQ